MAELRLAGACTLAEANQVLTEFLPRFNQRFGVAAAQLFEAGHFCARKDGYIPSIISVSPPTGLRGAKLSVIASGMYLILWGSAEFLALTREQWGKSLLGITVGLL